LDGLLFTLSRTVAEMTSSLEKKKTYLANNNDFRAFKRARLEAQGYKPPTPDWVARLGEHVPLLTLDFAEKVVAHWNRIDNPNDSCACAMDKLLEYHEHSPYINVLINFELEGYGIRTMGVITLRSAFLYALRRGYNMRVGYSMFGVDRIALDDDDLQFLELVYSADGNEFFAMCDGGYKKTTPYDDFTAWANVQPGYKKFCETPESRFTVDETLGFMRLAKKDKGKESEEEEDEEEDEDEDDSIQVDISSDEQ
jgi:hypothetical protein